MTSLKKTKGLIGWSVLLSFVIFFVLQISHYGVMKNDCCPGCLCSVPYTVSKNVYYLGYPFPAIMYDNFWTEPFFYSLCLINFLILFFPILVLLCLVSVVKYFRSLYMKR